MSKTKNVNIKADENPNEKFKRIVNPRLKKAVYELNRAIKMVSQPTYTIYDVDAQKILEYITPKFNEFTVLYEKIASGQTIKSNKKEDLKDVF
jgi:hypothetical protein